VNVNVDLKRAGTGWTAVGMLTGTPDETAGLIPGVAKVGAADGHLKAQLETVVGLVDVDIALSVKGGQ
jgi:carbon monoxide dehydrogenase subunit G